MEGVLGEREGDLQDTRLQSPPFDTEEDEDEKEK